MWASRLESNTFNNPSALCYLPHTRDPTTKELSRCGVLAHVVSEFQRMIVSRSNILTVRAVISRTANDTRINSRPTTKNALWRERVKHVSIVDLVDLRVPITTLKLLNQ